MGHIGYLHKTKNEGEATRDKEHERAVRKGVQNKYQIITHFSENLLSKCALNRSNSSHIRLTANKQMPFYRNISKASEWNSCRNPPFALSHNNSSFYVINFIIIKLTKDYCCKL